MSRIYRSLDLQQTKVNEVNLHERAMGPQHAARPAGGFQGVAGGGAGEGEPCSHLERREREAARIVEEARRQAEAIQRDAYHEGFTQGERAGERLALQKAEPVMAAMQELIAAIRDERTELIKAHEQELIKVAFAIAQQVLKTTIEMQPEVLRGVIEAALAKVGRAQEVLLRISPHDIKLLDPMMRRRGEEAWPPPHVRVESDETIGRGGCRVETETGDIDATIETQLRVLRNELWNE